LAKVDRHLRPGKHPAIPKEAAEITWHFEARVFRWLLIYDWCWSLSSVFIELDKTSAFICGLGVSASRNLCSSAQSADELRVLGLLLWSIS
jgi:hypothetical protein